MRKIIITMCALIFFTVSIAYTQDDLSQSYKQTESGITVLFPKDWVNMTEEIGVDDGSIILINSRDALQSTQAVQPDDILVQIASPSLLDAFVGGLSFDDAWSVLIENDIFSDGDSVDYEDSGNHIRLQASSIEDYANISGIVELDEGIFTVFLGTAHPDNMDEAELILANIMANLEYSTTIYNTLFTLTQPYQSEDETYAFSYPGGPDWIVYEQDDVAVVTNAESIEGFSGAEGEYLIVFSTVPAEEADEIALTTGMMFGVIQEIAFALTPLMTKANGQEVDTLGKLEGLVGLSVGVDFSMQTAIIAPEDQLPIFTANSGGQDPLRIAYDNGLATIMTVYGAVGEEDNLIQIIEFMVQSLRIPVDLSTIEVSDIDLPVTSDGTILFINHPEDWDTYVRGGFNVEGIPPGATDAVRLIVSGVSLEPGQTVEESLREFIVLFGYEIFDTIELSDGRIAYLGTDTNLTEAVIEVIYKDDFIVSMSFLPSNPDDYLVSLPVALAILESIELKID